MGKGGTGQHDPIQTQSKPISAPEGPKARKFGREPGFWVIRTHKKCQTPSSNISQVMSISLFS